MTAGSDDGRVDHLATSNGAVGGEGRSVRRRAARRERRRRRLRRTVVPLLIVVAVLAATVVGLNAIPSAPRPVEGPAVSTAVTTAL